MRPTLVVPSFLHGTPGVVASTSTRHTGSPRSMQAGVRNALPGATNAGHMQKGPVMQPELFPFPVSAAAQMRLNRIALRGALDSMVDVMTDLRKLPDEGFAPLKQMGFTLVSALDQEEKAYRGKVA